MSKKLYEDSNIQSIANAIRSKLGSNETYLTSEMAAAIAQIHGEPVLEALVANENGVYAPSTGKDGFSGVTVSVPASEPDLEELSVVQNGTYTPSTGKDGFSEVVVNVPSSGGGGTPIVPDEGTVFDSVTFSGAKDIELTNYGFDKYDEFELIYRKTGSNNGQFPRFLKVVGTNGAYQVFENRYGSRKVINVSYGSTSPSVFSGDNNVSIGNPIDNGTNVHSIRMSCVSDKLYFSYILFLQSYDQSTPLVSDIKVSDTSVESAYNTNGLSNGTCYLFSTQGSNYFNGMVFYTFIIRRNSEVIHEYVPFDNDGTLALKDLITNDIIETEIELDSSAYTNDNTYYVEYTSSREAVLIEKTVTENGTYDATDDEADGYSQVVVNMPSATGEEF